MIYRREEEKLEINYILKLKSNLVQQYKLNSPSYPPKSNQNAMSNMNCQINQGAQFWVKFTQF